MNEERGKNAGAVPGVAVEHVAWQVESPSEMVAWYVRHLGFRVLRGPLGGDDEVHFLEDASGRFVLEVYRKAELPEVDFRQRHPLVQHLAMESPDPVATVKHLLAAGASGDPPAVGGGSGNFSAMLRDPWGFPLQIVRRRPSQRGRRVFVVGATAPDPEAARPDLFPVGYLNPYSSGMAGRSATDNPVPVFEDVIEGLENSNADLVVVDVPNTAKNPVPVLEAVLRAGVPLAIRKLRCADWGEAAALAQIAEETGTPCFVQDQYHMGPAWQTARARLPEIGSIQTVSYRAAILAREEGFAPWVASYRHLMLEDLAYHHFSILHFLFGLDAAASFRSASRSLSADSAVRNAFDCLGPLANGGLLHYSACWQTSAPHTGWPGEMLVRGSRGSLFVSETEIRINDVSVPPAAWRSAADWNTLVLDHLNGRPTAPNCLCRIGDFVPVADFIAARLREVDSEEQR